MPQKRARRSFLIRSVGALGLGALSSRVLPTPASAADPAGDLAARGATILRTRLAEDGSWSGDRKEPGITALVVTALLQSRRMTPDEPAVARALA